MNLSFNIALSCVYFAIYMYAQTVVYTDATMGSVLFSNVPLAFVSLLGMLLYKVSVSSQSKII